MAVGPVIKDVLDRFLKTGRSFENAVSSWDWFKYDLVLIYRHFINWKTKFNTSWTCQITKRLLEHCKRRICQPQTQQEMIERFNTIDLTHWTRPNRILKKLNKGCSVSKMNIEDNSLILTFTACNQRLVIPWIHLIGRKQLEAKSLRSTSMIPCAKLKINKSCWIMRASMLCCHRLKMTSPTKKGKPRRRS